jgi:ABC-type glutathione transport system ATPase component
MSETAIRVQNLTKMYKLYDKHLDRLKDSLGLTKKKCYKEHYALNDISFEVKKGETVGIIGTNGSGKSTILKIITGVLQPTAGNLLVNGRISALLELGAGFNMEYTGIENIYLNKTTIQTNTHHARNRNNPITHRIEYLYDLCLVWPSQAAADETHIRQHPTLHRHPHQLVPGTLRICLPSTGQPHRIRRQWRCLHTHATQGDTGGHLHRHLHPLHHRLLQRRDTAVEPLRSLRMPHRGRILRIPEVG